MRGRPRSTLFPYTTLFRSGRPFRLRMEAALPWGALHTRTGGSGGYVRHRRPRWRLCSPSQTAFYGTSSCGSRWRHGFPKTVAMTNHERVGTARGLSARVSLPGSQVRAPRLQNHTRRTCEPPPFCCIINIQMHSAGKIAALPLVLAIAALAHPALQFALRDTEGVEHTPHEWAQAHAVVLFFVTTDC